MGDFESRLRLRQLGEADTETLTDAVSLWNKLVRLPTGDLDALTNYAMLRSITFEDAVVELVLKGLES